MGIKKAVLPFRKLGRLEQLHFDIKAGYKLKPLGKFLCFIGIHEWWYDCNGYTNEEFETCPRCHHHRNFTERL